jgi:hypothetical protein
VFVFSTVVVKPRCVIYLMRCGDQETRQELYGKQSTT